MTTKLEHLLLTLRSSLTKSNDPDNLQQAIHQLLEQHNLDSNQAAPSWIVELFNFVLKQQSTDWISYSEQGYSYSDLFSFLAELDQVLPLRYSHNEENISLRFEALQLEVIIWVESAQYKVAKVN